LKPIYVSEELISDAVLQAQVDRSRAEISSRDKSCDAPLPKTKTKKGAETKTREKENARKEKKNLFFTYTPKD
jgi:hypothetical protein